METSITPNYTDTEFTVPKEAEPVGVKLYHVSSWAEIKDKKVGDQFILVPGPQNAEGNGVYFSEGKPRFSAAESANLKGVQAIIEIEAASTEGWWCSKGFATRKFNRPRTWHTYGKDIACTVLDISEDDQKNLCYKCNWQFI